MYRDIKTLEEFKDTLMILYKQEWAIRDGLSYWEAQDTLVGEALDNKIRMNQLKENNPQFYSQIPNKLAFIKEAKLAYLRDREKADKDE